MACVSYDSAFSNKRQKKRRFLGFDKIASFCCEAMLLLLLLLLLPVTAL